MLFAQLCRLKSHQSLAEKPLQIPSSINSNLPNKKPRQNVRVLSIFIVTSHKI